MIILYYWAQNQFILIIIILNLYYLHDSNIIVNVDITDQQGNILNIVDIENLPMTIIRGDVSKIIEIKSIKRYERYL